MPNIYLRYVGRPSDKEKLLILYRAAGTRAYNENNLPKPARFLCEKKSLEECYNSPKSRMK